MHRQTDAPSDDQLAALKRRSHRLASCLAPAGELFVAKIVGNLSIGLKKRQRSEREADVAMKQLLDGLRDLPMFALDQAADDFLRGNHGDGWMPDLAELRPHAVSKLQAPALERRTIEKIVNARVRPPVDAERKARAIAAVRSSLLQEMKVAGVKAEAERRGLVEPLTAEALMAKTNARFDQGMPAALATIPQFQDQEMDHAKG